MKCQMAIERLREALRRREYETLGRAIKNAEQQGIPEDNEDLQEAKQELDFVGAKNRESGDAKSSFF